MRDICYQCIEEGARIALSMEELSVYQSVFEATDGDEKAQEVEKENAEKAKKSASFFKKAVDAIRAVYAKIKNSLKNLIDRLKLSGDEKKEYEAFLQEVKSNPEFKNKKVSVHDWRQIRKSYDQVVKELTTEIERVARTNEELKPNFVQTMEAKLKNLAEAGKGAVVAVTLGQLAEQCRNDEDRANAVYRMLNSDLLGLDQFAKQFGVEDIYNKTKKEIKGYQSGLHIRRILAKLRTIGMDLDKQCEYEMRHARKRAMKDVRKTAMAYGGDAAKAVVSTGLGAIGVAANQFKDDGRELMKNRKQIKKNEQKAEKNTAKDKARAKRREIDARKRETRKKKADFQKQFEAFDTKK